MQNKRKHNAIFFNDDFSMLFFTSTTSDIMMDLLSLRDIMNVASTFRGIELILRSRILNNKDNHLEIVRKRMPHYYKIIKNILQLPYHMAEKTISLLSTHLFYTPLRTNINGYLCKFNHYFNTNIVFSGCHKYSLMDCSHHLIREYMPGKFGILYIDGMNICHLDTARNSIKKFKMKDRYNLSTSNVSDKYVGMIGQSEVNIFVQRKKDDINPMFITHISKSNTIFNVYEFIKKECCTKYPGL